MRALEVDRRHPCGEVGASAENGFDLAVRAVDYRLVFVRESGPRRFDQATMFGQDVPDAYNPGASVVGEWYGGDVLVAQWWQHFAGMAVGEAIHEALEYFRVNGGLWLDPHGPHRNTIHLLVEDFVARLAALRDRTPETAPLRAPRDEGAADDR